jgi:hypothetical protein
MRTERRWGKNNVQNRKLAIIQQLCLVHHIKNMNSKPGVFHFIDVTSNLYSERISRELEGCAGVLGDVLR